MELNGKRTRDWSKYNAAAKKCGDVTLYITPEAIAAWYTTELTGERGASDTYSDMAIEACLMVRAIYKLPLRKANGFIQSLFTLMKLPISCPDYTTLCRRAKHIKVTYTRPAVKGPIVIAIDSTGIKVYGEGEWKVRQHGVSKRRTWLKLHVAVNVQDNHVEACMVTKNNVADSTVAPELLSSIPVPIAKCTADGAYDTIDTYKALEALGATPIIPPRKDAQPQPPDQAISAKEPRDAAINTIKNLGGDDQARKEWKQQTGYHVRSLAETCMYRYKTHFGPTVRARTFENQAAEVQINVKILNKIAALGTFSENRAASIRSLK